MRRPQLGRLVPAPVRAFAARPVPTFALSMTRRSLREFRDDNCPELAAAVSYHLLFSIFPLAIAGVGALGLVVRSPERRDALIAHLLTVLPLSGDGREQVRSMVTSISGTGGALGLIGLVGVIWSASGVMTAVRKAINIAWDIEVRRPFVRGKAMDLLLLAGTFVLLGATLGVVLLASLIHQSAADLPGVASLVAGPGSVVLVGAVVLALLIGLFAGLYLLLPATRVRLRDALIGAAVAAVGTAALQLGFSVYVSNFAHYNRVYGSLGAIIAFLFFVYLAAMVFLFGAEVASELPRPPADE